MFRFGAPGSTLMPFDVLDHAEFTALFYTTGGENPAEAAR
jgi:hypothetical protein